MRLKPGVWAKGKEPLQRCSEVGYTFYQVGLSDATQGGLRSKEEDRPGGVMWHHQL